MCGRPISGQSVEQIADQVLALPEGTRFLVLAPLVRDRKGEHRDVLEQVRAEGFTRVAVDGETYLLDEVPALDKKFTHTVEVVVDRLVMRDDLRAAPHRQPGDRDAAVRRPGAHRGRCGEGGRSFTYSERFACPEHGASLPELAPRTFSFNSPHGACPTCTGLGFTLEVDPELVVDPERTLREGAVLPWTDRTTDYYDLLLDVIATTHSIDLDTVWRALPQRHRDLMLNGPRSGRERVFLGRRRKGGGSWGWFEGVLPQLRRQHATSMSHAMRESVEQFMSLRPCPACGGARLRPESLAVTVGGRNISEVCLLSVADAVAFFASLELTDTQALIGARVIQEINERLRFLDDVGVGYLTLARAAGTLSGGEAQRIRLATQIGSGLVGVLYILDEPSIGLHQRDNRKLIGTLERLRDQGNTVLVVEHDEEMIRSADHVIDMGPGAGQHGGRVVAEGTVADIEAEPASVTGAFLSGRRGVEVPAVRRRGPGLAHRGGGAGEQPARRRRGLPGRRPHLRHRGVRLRQEHAGQPDAAEGAVRAAQPAARAPRRPRPHRGARALRQGHRHRPVAHRPHAAQQPGHLHGPVRPHPPALLHDPGGALARLLAGALQLQRQGRPLRGVQGRRHDHDRDALPARRLRAVRGVRRQALQPRDPRPCGTAAAPSTRCSR